MASPEHVAVVRRGRDALAEWQERNPEGRLDLSGANLLGADLSGANLSGANLSGANLSGADLSGANLSRAILLSADLSGAILSGANLLLANPSDADLSGANLSDANLSGAILSGANLSDANLSGAILSGANLSGADLSGANLLFAILSDANLSGAKLARAYLFGAYLAGANLTEAQCAFTAFASCDLSGCQGLETVTHSVLSSIDVDTLVRTLRGAGSVFTRDQTAFFTAAGVPGQLLEALPRIVREIKYDSCFVAFGAPDEEFASRLTKDLKQRGVTTWFFPEDAKRGENILREEQEWRKSADKVIVVCSVQGLGQHGLLREIDEQAQEDPKRLLPVLLDRMWLADNVIVERDGRGLKPYLRYNNFWVDFSNKSYEEAVVELLKALERPKPPARRRENRPTAKARRR